MNNKLLWIITFIFSLFLGQIAFADSQECGGGMKKMLDSLNLSNSQKDKLRSIFEQSKASMKDTRSQMKDLRLQISKQVESDTMDQKVIDGLIESKLKLETNMMKTRISIQHQIYMLLNDQQKIKYHNKMKELDKKFAMKYEHCKGQE